MRSGVITQKVGMTRVCSPRRAACAGHGPEARRLPGRRRTAPRRRTATPPVSSARAFAKAKNVAKAERGHFAKAEVEPKRKLAEFRVDDEALIRVGDEIKADHFVAGQKVDVTGVTIGRGFTGAMKRWNFRGLEASTACRSRTVRSAAPAAARIRARPSRTRRCTAITASRMSPRRISKWRRSMSSAA